MNLKLVHCSTIQALVSVVTDLEGAVSSVICPEYLDATRSCRLKMEGTSGGPLSRLLERVSGHTLGTHGHRCDVRG